jgi:hypothetical protein
VNFSGPPCRHFSAIRPVPLVLEGAPIMLAFLIGTSILNIFVGYALAVYLMRESLTSQVNQSGGNLSRPNDGSSENHRDQSQLYPSNEAVAPSPSLATDSTANKGADLNGYSGDQTGASSTNSNGNAVSTAGDPIDRGPEEMDQQLLAGIADFRSQLAKLRAEPNSEEPKRRPVSRSK